MDTNLRLSVWIRHLTSNWSSHLTLSGWTVLNVTGVYLRSADEEWDRWRLSGNDDPRTVVSHRVAHCADWGRQTPDAVPSPTVSAAAGGGQSSQWKDWQPEDSPGTVLAAGKHHVWMCPPRPSSARDPANRRKGWTLDPSWQTTDNPLVAAPLKNAC